MRGGNKGMINCLTGLAFTREVLDKLNKFSMAQQELSQALVGAPPLGICKITTYVDQKFVFKSLDLTRDVGHATTRTVTILTKEDLKEMLL